MHQGRFGFPVSNFLALTPLNNAWCDTWTEFFKRRMSDQIEGLLKVQYLAGGSLPCRTSTHAHAYEEASRLHRGALVWIGGAVSGNAPLEPPDLPALNPLP